ncbi:MAG: 16S rRNA (guanine(966)-N(2))-methyltransferase RsmD [Phycisphaerae bacterium]
MRVIAGAHRGALLDAPPGRNTRPITDRVKESLFSILGVRFGTLADLPAFDVLDVFAGSGALGLEALSRGARSCTFVERDPAALRTLRGNIQRLRVEGEARVAPLDVWKMRLAPHAPDGFGLIFCDPPYQDSTDPARVAKLLERLAASLSRAGILVFRHDGRREDHGMPPPSLTRIDQREYGGMHVLLFMPSTLNPPSAE